MLFIAKGFLIDESEAELRDYALLAVFGILVISMIFLERGRIQNGVVFSNLNNKQKISIVVYVGVWISILVWMIGWFLYPSIKYFDSSFSYWWAYLVVGILPLILIVLIMYCLKKRKWNNLSNIGRYG